MKVEHAWRSITRIVPHPGNGSGNGGCIVGTVWVWLVCGHVKTMNKSRRVYLGKTMRCKECEAREAKR